MDKTKMTYFKDEDVLHLALFPTKKNPTVWKMTCPNVTAEFNEHGDLIGIEILEATSFIRDSIFESVQAKVLNIQKMDSTTLHMDG